MLTTTCKALLQSFKLEIELTIKAFNVKPPCSKKYQVKAKRQQQEAIRLNQPFHIILKEELVSKEEVFLEGEDQEQGKSDNKGLFDQVVLLYAFFWASIALYKKLEILEMPICKGTLIFGAVACKIRYISVNDYFTFLVFRCFDPLGPKIVPQASLLTPLEAKKREN